jgi:PAS domain S-box-containing protein
LPAVLQSFSAKPAFMKFNLTNDRIIKTGVALLLAAIITIIVLSIDESQKTNDTARWVAHTQEVLFQSEKVLTLLVDNETGGRGYIITGNKAFLEPLEKSEKEIYNTLAGLKALTSDNSSQQILIDSLTFYIDKRISFSNRTTVARDLNGINAATALVGTGEGKLYTDRIRLFTDKMQATENVLLAQRKKTNERLAGMMNNALLFLALAVLILSLIMLLLFRNQQTQKNKNRDELRLQVRLKTAELNSFFERITDAFVAFDNNWCYTYMNMKAGEIFNCDPANVIGKHIFTEFTDGIGQIFYKAYCRAMDEQRYIHVEEYYPPYGCWFENYIYPSADGLSVFFRDITERKKSEEEIKEKGKFIESIINASPDIIYIYDIEERKNVFVNEGIQTNLGYTDADVQAMGDQLIPTLMHPEDFDFYLHNTYPQYEALRDKEIIAYEYRMKDKTGNWHWLDSKESVFLRKPYGTAKQVFGIATDITERKKAEEEVAKVYKEMHTALNRITNSIVSVDREWRYTFLNDAAMATHPMGREETMGKIIWEVHPQLSETVFGQKFKEVMQTQIATEFENYYPPFNIWVNMKIYPSANGLTLYYEDITESKKAETDIKKFNERFEMIARTTNDALWEWNLETGELWSNPKHQHLYGLTAADPVPKEDEWGKKIHPDNREKIIASQQEALASDKNVWISEYLFKTKNDGYIDIYDRCYIVRNEEGKPIRLTGTMMDITERKKAETEIKEKAIQLQTLSNNLPDSMMYQVVREEDGSMRFAYVSETVKQFTGKTSEEVLQSQALLHRIIHEEDVPKVTAAEAISFRDMTVFNIEVRSIGLAGEQNWVHVRSVPRRLADGRVLWDGIMTDVTEHKKAADAVLKEKELSESIINSLPGLFYLVDEKGNYIRWNKQKEKISGYTAAEISRMNSVDFFEGEEKEFVRQKIKDGFANGTTELEADLVTKNGNKIPFYFTGIAINYNGSQCLLGTGIDISERKKAEEGTIKEKELSDSVINSLPGIFYISDLTPRLLRWNKSLETFSGYSAEELSEIVPITLFEENSHTALRQSMEKAYKEGAADAEVQLLTKNGKKIPFYFTGVSIEYKGKPVMLGTGIDITERKKAQVALAESENYLRTILHTEPECVKVLNSKGELLSMNPAGLAMIEADNEQQVLGHRMTELVDEKYRVGFNWLSKNVFSGNSGTFEFEVTGLKGGHRWLETRAVPLKDAGGKITSLLGVTRDITERKKAEEEINNSNEQLRQLTAHLQNIREEERKRIGREIHDELGQQLTAIKMDVVWIDKKIPEETITVKAKLNNIITLLDGSSESIRKILNELRHGILEDNGLLEALEWQGNQFTESTGIPVKFITTETVIELPLQIADCIFRVYQESLTNIMRYAQAGKVISSFHIEENKIIFTVEDDGKGFDTLAIQSKKSFGILGMQERAHSLNGKFTIDSAEGKGTKIIISLPYKTTTKT